MNRVFLSWGAPLWMVCMALLVVPAYGAPVDASVEAPITAVTVYPGTAQVTRTAQVQLRSGTGVVMIAGLPDQVIAESVRIAAAGPEGLTIASVESRWQHQSEVVGSVEKKLQGELQALKDQQRAINDRIAVSNDQLNFIRGIRPHSDAKEVATPTPAQWEATWKLIGTGASASLKEIQLQQIKLREVMRQVEQKQHELQQVRTGSRKRLEVKVHYQTPSGGKARFTMKYQVRGASWTPRYDARLDADSGQLVLEQTGQVQQRSGADWSGVALTLSTARPTMGTNMPEPQPWWIDLAQNFPVNLPRSEMAFSSGMADGKLMAEVMSDDMPRRRNPMKAAKMAQATTHVATFAAEYQVAGTHNVPSDGAPHRFGLATYQGAVDLSVHSYPQVDPRGYLMAQWDFDGKAPLLPGRVSLYLDGELVGQSALSLTRPGEELKLSFGVDDKVRVRYEVDTNQRSQSGIISHKKRVERRYRMIVDNHHSRAITVTLLDRVPVPKNDDITVRLLSKYTTAPTKTDYKDRKGVLAWINDMAPGSSLETRFGYEVAYPADEVVPGF